ncbi:hypothetical protein ACFL5L_05895 [candidate division KSB1 bacterium]
MNVNLGCGGDYREGWINVDGSNKVKADRYFDIRYLHKYIEKESVDYFLLQDILEHFYHWEAHRILCDVYSCLKVGGKVEIRVPDCGFIMWYPFISIEEKLLWLYGGQDIPQGSMDDSRRDHPEFFCHRYGWNRRKMKRELRLVGFKDIRFRWAKFNFVTYAIKRKHFDAKGQETEV